MEEDKIEEVENVEVEVELTTEPLQVEEQLQTKLSDEPPPPVKTESKPKKGHRPSLNRGPLTEKDNCPYCNKLISKHSLIYKKHKCAAKNSNEMIITDVVDNSPKNLFNSPKVSQTANNKISKIMPQPPPPSVEEVLYNYLKEKKLQEQSDKKNKIREMMRSALKY